MLRYATLLAALSLALPVGAQAKVDAPRLYVFDCGSIDVADISVFSPGVNQGQKRTLASPCYLVVHPKGTLMWDTGLGDPIAAMPDGKRIGSNFLFKVGKTLASQLKEIGVDPAGVNYLAISHMHSDHAGNTHLFPKATLLMQKEEFETAFGPEAAKFYSTDNSAFAHMKSNPLVKLTGDHDVFGDGTVTIKRMLGHTAGHQVLYLKLPKTGKVMLSGDLVHFQSNWENLGVPGFNLDKVQSVAAMKQAKAFLAKEKAELWIQHDPEQYARTRLAPHYYE
jgi:glyoxylase-like metal-dependent hydrolase (beta-lactamase superfamily II)